MNYAQYTLKDALVELTYRSVFQSALPGRLFNPGMPKKQWLRAFELPMHIEVVSHCWNYSVFLQYQLASILKFPPKDTQVTVTVFYSEEDTHTRELLKYFQEKAVKNVHWNFKTLDKRFLMRRAIGRNLAAKDTEADWIWFTDCDLIFGPEVFDRLAAALCKRKEFLVYPEEMRVTKLLPAESPLLTRKDNYDDIFDIFKSEFQEKHNTRATGPIQIVHGDVARACGYCDSLEFYQKGQEEWKKAYEDRAFRWLLGTQGVPIDLPNVYIIRHEEKGRYRNGSTMSNIRRWIRSSHSRIFIDQ